MGIRLSFLRQSTSEAKRRRRTSERVESCDVCFFIIVLRWLTNTFPSFQFVLWSFRSEEERKKKLRRNFLCSTRCRLNHEISHLTIFLSFNFSFSFSFLSSRFSCLRYFFLNASLCSLFFALKLKPVYEGRNVLKIFFFFSLAESFFYFTFNVSSCLRNTFDLSRSAQLASLAFRFDSSARWKGKKKKEKRLKEILKLTLKLFLLALFPSRIRLACLIENFPQKTRSKNWKRGKKESIL